MEKLEEVFQSDDEIDKVGDYLKKHSLQEFRTTSGQLVRKVSIKKKPISNYYVKRINDDNFSVLGLPKYYCIEIYEDKLGNLKMWGLRYVDLIKKGDKLYLKGTLPEDYGKHYLYLHKGDYVEIKAKKGKSVLGFYQNAYNVNQSMISVLPVNSSNEPIPKIISKNITIKKYDINILGVKGGLIREDREGFSCIVPLLSKTEKN